EPTGLRKISPLVACRNTMARGERRDYLALLAEPGIDPDLQGFYPLPDHALEGVLQLTFAAGGENVEPQPKRISRCSDFGRVQFDVRIGRVDKKAEFCRLGHKIVQQTEALCDELVA